MNNSLGFLLAYKSAEGLSKNKKLLYGILGAQAPAGDLSQVALPVLLAKREVKNLPQPTPTPSPPGEKPPQNGSPDFSSPMSAITEEQLDVVRRYIPLNTLRELKQEIEELEKERKAREEEKQQYGCIFDCLQKVKPKSEPAEDNAKSQSSELVRSE